MATADFEKLFASIGERVKQTLAEVPAPQGRVYACSFWLFYADYTIIGVPSFAYNLVGNENDAKWSPPEWIVSTDERMVEALQPLYQQLTDLMDGQSDETWDAILQFQWDYFSQLCREITRDARLLLSHWQLTADFVCGIFEEREDEEIYLQLLSSSIGDDVVERLGILPGS